MALTSQLEKYNPDWPNQFNDEAELLKPLFGNDLHSIHHVGSTAIPEVVAKPEIDILVVLKDEADFQSYFSKIEYLGYDFRGEEPGVPGHWYFSKNQNHRRTHKLSNRRRLPPELEKGASYFANFRDMLPHCEILSLNAPGTAETKHIMNDETLALLPPNAVLVNVARGSLVDEAALIRALASGHLFAAGLDVFEQEPHYNQELLKYHNVFLTPHMGSATQETREAMGFRALENISRVLQGERPQDPLW